VRLDKEDRKEKRKDSDPTTDPAEGKDQSKGGGRVESWSLTVLEKKKFAAT